MAGQLKRKQIEFNSILKEKDSHIKLVTDIVSKSSSVTAQLNVENLKLQRDKKNALQEKDIAQAQALTDIKKQANAIIQEKNRNIKQGLQSEVREMEN